MPVWHQRPQTWPYLYFRVEILSLRISGLLGESRYPNVHTHFCGYVHLCIFLVRRFAFTRSLQKPQKAEKHSLKGFSILGKSKNTLLPATRVAWLFIKKCIFWFTFHWPCVLLTWQDTFHLKSPLSYLIVSIWWLFTAKAENYPSQNEAWYLLHCLTYERRHRAVAGWNKSCSVRN